jgi:DNA-binding response OmpR family regulator
MGEADRTGKEGADILVVEDDALLAATIRAAWPAPADRLRFVSNYRQSLRFIHSGEISFFDGAIVDVNLPDGDGLAILQAIRAHADIPIILISGSGTGNSRADAIELGADDYVMKPFHIRELQARLSRLIKMRNLQRQEARRPVFQLDGHVTCDLERRELRSGDKTVALTDAEARLLGYLYENRGRIASKDALYKNAFFRAYAPDDKTLDVYVSRLRRKLGSLDAGLGRRIQTVRGTGYRYSV